MITFNGRLNTPSYEALSTDLIAGILPGVINPGLTIYFSDTHTWKIVVDGTGLLADYSLPVSVTATFTGSDASAANQTAVQAVAGVARRAAGSYPATGRGRGTRKAAASSLTRPFIPWTF